MKNREKYKEFLDDCLVDHVGFGVDKDSNKPYPCDKLDCTSDCKFYCACGPCNGSRRNWLDQECDDWADFRDLKRGDIIMLSVSGLWYPVIFVRFDEFGLRYSRSIDNRGDFVCEVGFEEHPKHVKKCLKNDIC